MKNNKFHALKSTFPFDITIVIFSYCKYKYNPTRHLLHDVSKKLPRQLCKIINDYFQVGNFGRLPLINRHGSLWDQKTKELLQFFRWVHIYEVKYKCTRLTVRDFTKMARKFYRTDKSPFDPFSEQGQADETNWYENNRWSRLGTSHCLKILSSFSGLELQIFLEHDPVLQKQFVYQLSQIFCSGKHSMFWGRISSSLGNRLLCIVEKLLDYSETYKWVCALAHEFAVYKKMNSYSICTDLIIRLDKILSKIKYCSNT